MVHVWKAGTYKYELAKVTALGYNALLSSCWYLNHITYGIDWPKIYLCDPQDFHGNQRFTNNSIQIFLPLHGGVVTGIIEARQLTHKGEHNGSVVECLTRDRGAAGLSLTGVTVLCP